jgi:hypothetical protein
MTQLYAGAGGAQNRGNNRDLGSPADVGAGLDVFMQRINMRTITKNVPF